MLAFDSVTIDWVRTRYHGVEAMPHCYLYAVTCGKQLRYIGESYDSAPDRVKQIGHIRAKYENDLLGCWIWFGYINRSNFDRISQERIFDIESLLIYLNQPLDNVPHKKNYRTNGRQNLIVHCRGCPHLLPKVQVREGLFSPKAKLLG